MSAFIPMGLNPINEVLKRPPRRKVADAALYEVHGFAQIPGTCGHACCSVAAVAKAWDATRAWRWVSQTGTGRRVMLAVAGFVVGGAVLWPLLPVATNDFAGSVLALPADAGCEAVVSVRYLPDDKSSLAGAQNGDLSIALTDESDSARAAGYSRWYLYLRNDARLTNPQIVNSDGQVVRPAEYETVNLNNDDLMLQEYNLELPKGWTLQGRPLKSPLSARFNEGRISMPGVATPAPTAQEDERSKGGVVLLEEAYISLIPQVREQQLPKGWLGPQAPRTAFFVASTGMSANSEIAVTRSTPELDKDKWADVIAWTSANPLQANVNISWGGTSLARDVLLSVTFLFFGMSLTLLADAFVESRRAATVGVQADRPAAGMLEQAVPANAPATNDAVRTPASKAAATQWRRGGGRRRKRR